MVEVGVEVGVVVGVVVGVGMTDSTGHAPERPSPTSGKVSATCEVWLGRGSESACGKPTTHAYPAMGGGYMALCTEHAQKHLRYCVTFEAARRGEKPVLEKGS